MSGFLAHSRRAWSGALALTCATVGTVALAAPAAHAATTLNGDWGPFTRCPVDASSMLAADGKTVAASCTVASSASGTMKLGNTTVNIGETNLQFGLLLPSSGTDTTLVSPDGGAMVSPPVDIPGGLLGLMCPSNVPVISQICDAITNSSLNRVTATVEPAGDPSGFSLSSGASVGKPILSVPIKIALKNPFLASTCTIGSDKNPIVLKPENVAAPSMAFEHFDPDGTPDTSGTMSDIVLTGTQRDDTFAVPGASGCGLLGALNLAVDLKEGLPSKSGNNKLVLNNTVTHALAGFANPRAQAPNEGQNLADVWHSAQQ